MHTLAFFDSTDDGLGDFRGLAAEARLPAVARHRLRLAAAVLSLAAPGRRLRHRRLLLGQPRLRHRRGPADVRRGRARARHPRDRRPRHEPHVERPPVVPGVALVDRTARSATGTCGPTPCTATRTRGSSSSTPRPRTGRGTRVGGLLLAPLLPPPAGPQLREPRGAGGDARRAALLARPRAGRLPPRRRPLPVRGGGDELREPPATPTSSSSACGPRSTPTTRTACCSPRRTSGRRTSSTTSATATSATWPSTSRSCRGCSWPLRREEAQADRSRSSIARRRSPTVPSGGSSCATTTSSRSRWSPTRSATTCTRSTRTTRA